MSRLYIAYSPSQLRMIASISAGELGANCVYFGDENFDDIKKLCISLNLNVKFYGASFKRVSSLNNETYKAISKEIFVGYEEIVMPTLSYPINNWIYVKFRKIKSIYLYADGLSAYLNIRPLFFMHGFKAIVAGLINFFIYGRVSCLISGHLYGYNMTNICGVYVDNQEAFQKVNSSANAIKYDFLPSDNKYAAVPGRCLFIGQPHLNKNLSLDEIFDKLAKSLRSNGATELYYKPHPFEDAKIKSAASYNDFEIIDSTVPVEMLVSQIKPSIVSSFRSTALLAIKKEFPELICLSFFYDVVLAPYENFEIDELLSIFRSLDIKFFSWIESQ